MATMEVKEARAKIPAFKVVEMADAIESTIKNKPAKKKKPEGSESTAAVGGEHKKRKKKTSATLVVGEDGAPQPTQLYQSGGSSDVVFSPTSLNFLDDFMPPKAVTETAAVTSPVHSTVITETPAATSSVKKTPATGNKKGKEYKDRNGKLLIVEPNGYVIGTVAAQRPGELRVINFI